MHTRSCRATVQVKWPLPMHGPHELDEEVYVMEMENDEQKGKAAWNFGSHREETRGKRHLGTTPVDFGQLSFLYTLDKIQCIYSHTPQLERCQDS